MHIYVLLSLTEILMELVLLLLWCLFCIIYTVRRLK